MTKRWWKGWTKPAGERKHKYGAQRAVSVDGKEFPSKHERNRYEELRVMQMAGEIRDLELQPVFEFVNKKPNGDRVKLTYASGRAVRYIADFRYHDVVADQVKVEDAKGMDTPVSKLKRALVRHYHGIDVALV